MKDRSSGAAFRFQNAGSDETYLLEILLDASEGATSGGGIFAWTNTSGTNALLSSRNFSEFLRHNVFELVVGIDSITNEAAIRTLIAAVDRWPNLSVRVFMHDQAGLFHPKMAWFETRDDLTLIVGSGNLTMAGLKSNWEAFAVVNMAGPEAVEVLEQINQLLVSWSESLFHVDDPRVMERAKLNIGNERSLKRGSRTSVPPPSVTNEGTQLLIAEIPKVVSRPSQANFSVDVYENFFGAMRDTKRQVLLFHVRNDGTLDGVESRQGVVSRSRNYRFELNGLKDLPPYDGYAIGVFLHLESGQFLYSIALPGSTYYEEILQFLDLHWNGPVNQRRRYRTKDIEEFQNLLQDLPIWKASLPDL